MITRIRSWWAQFETYTLVHYLLLALIVGAGALLRFYKLGEWSFWIDEVETIIRVRQGYDTGINLMQPLSTRLVDVALAALGISEWNARLVPALFGIVSGALLFFPIRRLFGPAVALLAVLFLTLSPWHIYWSQNARFYTALMLFFSLAFFTFLIGLEQQRPWYFVVALLFLGLATLERMLALLLIPVVFVLLLVRFALAGSFPRLQTRGMILLLLSPLLFVLVDLLYGVVFGGNSLFLFQTRVFFDKFVGNVNLSPVRLLLAFIYRIGLPMACIAGCAGLYMAVATRERKHLLIFLGATVPVLALLLLSFFTTTQDRYLFMILPCWLVLGAIAVKELYTRTPGIGKVMAVGIAVLLAGDYLSQNIVYYEYQNGFRMDWKGVFAMVQQNQAPDDLIITSRPKVGDYYMGEEVTRFDEVMPEDVVNSGQRVWFVLDTVSEIGRQNPSLKAFAETQATLMDVREVHMPGKIMRIRLYLYDPARRPEDSLVTFPGRRPAPAP